MKTITSRYDTRFGVIDKIATMMFEAEKRRLQQWIDNLDGENRSAWGDNTLLGFMYLGRYYRPSHVEGRDPINVKPLHQTLASMVDAFLADEKTVESDQAFIRQGLYTLLDPCKDLQDIRDALPEYLIDFFPELKAYERSRPEEWTIQGNPRGLKQFDKIRSKLEAYAVARMLY